MSENDMNSISRTDCIPPDIATRASFLARLHKEKKLEKRLTRIIQERIDIEENAFA